LWAALLLWLKDNQVGDLTAIAGVVISVIGFIATLRGVRKTKSAAKSAEEAAKSTRDSIRLFDSVVDFSATIAALEEIKRLQRQDAWSLLPDRYAAIRKLLISFRESTEDLTDDQISQIQEAIVNFRAIESKIDRSQRTPT
jgi:ribosomal protein S13